jgi:hypothetical protein
VSILFDVIGAFCTLCDSRRSVVKYPRRMQSAMHVYEVLLAIAQVTSYIPGGASSFWKLIGLLLLVAGFLIALWLIWVVLRWVAKKGAATFGKK